MNIIQLDTSYPVNCLKYQYISINPQLRCQIIQMIKWRIHLFSKPHNYLDKWTIQKQTYSVGSIQPDLKGGGSALRCRLCSPQPLWSWWWRLLTSGVASSAPRRSVGSWVVPRRLVAAGRHPLQHPGLKRQCHEISLCQIVFGPQLQNFTF